MLIRVSAALIGAANLGQGLYATFWPQSWYHAAPGASETGPFNSHFVTDIGLGFTAAGLAFLGFALWPRLRLLALGASGFVVFHGLFHLKNIVSGHHEYVMVDLLIALIAFAGLALCWPRKEATS